MTTHLHIFMPLKVFMMKKNAKIKVVGQPPKIIAVGVATRV